MRGMMNEKYNAPNSPCCGRPINYAPEQKCKCYDNCLSETCGKMPACIRNKQPDCLAKAVIPAVTVDSVDGLTNLANCFVHVTSINTTFYIDDKHRPMFIWAGPVETEVPADITTDEQFAAFVKSFNLRGQFLYAKYHSSDTDQDGIMAIYFDKNGKPFWAGEYNEMTEEPLI